MRAGHQSHAFSLLEIIISAAILSVLFIFVFNLFPSSMFALRRAEHGMDASNIAASILDEHRTRGFAAVRADVPLPPQSLPPVAAGGTQFSPTVDVIEHTPRLLEVRVSVSWQMGATTRQVTDGLYIPKISN